MTATTWPAKTIFRRASVSHFCRWLMDAPSSAAASAMFYDDINLNVATFSQLQDRILTRFGPDGLQVIGSPERQRFEFTGAKLRTPRSVNWNVEFDREWLKNLFVRVGYQQRQARREFILNPIDSTAERHHPWSGQFR